jgi:hypothetical protein
MLDLVRLANVNRFAVLSLFVLAFTAYEHGTTSPGLATTVAVRSGQNIANFYPARLTVTLHFSNGESRSYPAANHTTNPSGDPCTVGSHGPCPAGRWFLNPPDFVQRGTARYRRVGAAFFLIGRPGSIPFDRSVGLHAGTDSHLDLTYGCIRMKNADLEEVLAYLNRTGLVIEAISIPGTARCTDATLLSQPPHGNLLDLTIQREARSAGVNYSVVLDEAKGLYETDLDEMFKVTPYMDGGAGEEHARNLYSLLTKFGDRAYATVLAKESSTVRNQVVKALDFFAATESSLDKNAKKWARKFPLTYGVGLRE